MLWIWMYVIPTVILTVTQCFTFISLMESRLPRKKTIYISIVFVTLVLIVCMAGCWYGRMERTTEWSLLILTLPSVIYFFLISKYRDLRFLTTYCLSDVSIAAMDYMGYVLCIMIFGKADAFWSFPIRSCLILAAGLGVYFFVRPHYSTALSQLKRGWGIMLSVVVLAYVLMSLLSAYPKPIAQRPEDALVSVIAMLFLEAMMAVLIYMIASMLTTQKKALREKEMAMQLKLAKQQYDALNSSMEQNRIMRHDLKHHLQMIDSMCREGDLDKLQEYLKTQVTWQNNSPPQLCRNYVANLLLSHYRALCEENGIKFKCQASLPQKIPMEDGALTVLLGNALSNALEACQKAPAGQGEISVSLTFKQNTLMMKVENTCTEPPAEKDGVLLSAKGEGHGLGLLSIQQMAERSSGLARWTYEDGYFRLNVALPINDRSV